MIILLVAYTFNDAVVADQRHTDGNLNILLLLLLLLLLLPLLPILLPILLLLPTLLLLLLLLLDFLNAFYRILKLSNLCNNDILQGILLSLLPLELHNSSNDNSIEYINKLMNFIDDNFDCNISKYVDDVDDIDDLLNVIERRSGSIHQLVLIFIGLLRSLNISTRYVRTIDPRGAKPSDHLDIVERVYREANQDKPLQKKQRKREIILLDDIVDNDNNDNNDNDNDNDDTVYKYRKKCTALADIPFTAWIEVCLSDENKTPAPSHRRKEAVQTSNHKKGEIIDLVDDDDDDDDDDDVPIKSTSNAINTTNKSFRWIHVDLNSNTIDETALVEASRPNKRPVAYVIGCDNNQRAKDLTKRYAQQYSVTKKVRLHDLSPGNFSITHAIASTAPRHTSSDDILRNDNEDFELLERVTVNAPPPTTVNGFKNHPLYILKKDIKKSQQLRPKAKVSGMVKGQIYYNRSDITDLHTKTNWGKLMREIKEGEKPAKIETRTVKGKELSSELFAEWQTQPLVVPSVVDGVIPVNKYGNIEIWKYNLALVPKGATFLTNEDAPAAQKVAQSLELPYAKALVDFEIKKGNSFPKFGGIIVLNEHAQLIRDSSRNIEHHNAEVALQKHEKAIVSKWENLVRDMLKRNALKEKYGH